MSRDCSENGNGPKCVYATADLKGKLREHKLPTSGSKNELIIRLMEADPDGAWLREDEEGSHIDHVDSEIPNVYRREAELYKREKELAERELISMRQEMEMLRNATENRDANHARAERRQMTHEDVDDSNMASRAGQTHMSVEPLQNYSHRPTENPAITIYGNVKPSS